jgi:hypothetical protein
MVWVRSHFVPGDGMQFDAQRRWPEYRLRSRHAT